MPKLAKPVYTPNDDKWWRDTAEAADKERLERKAVINTAWDYYYGRHKPPLKVRPGGPNYNVILNFCGQALDALVAFLGVPDLRIEGGTSREPDASGVMVTTVTTEQARLTALWDANDLELQMTDLLLSGFVAGHSFLKLLPVLSAAGAVEDVRIELLDPRHVTVFWSHYREPLFYRLKWMVDATETRTQDIVPGWMITSDPSDDPTRVQQADGAPDAPTGWRIFEYAERNSQRRELVGDDAWPHPYPPIVDWKNAPKPFDYYGRSDLGDATIRKNDAANFVASDIQKILYHHAGPQTVITGGGLPADWASGPDKVIELDDPEAKVYNLEMASDLTASLSFLNVVRGAFFEGVKVVDRASIKDKLGDLTNFAVRMLYGAQHDAAAQKQTLYGRGLARASERALDLLGVEAGRVEAAWDDLLPQDRAAVVQAVGIEADLGIVSDETLLEELGHDPAQEAERRTREQDTQRTSVAEALVQLGQRGAFGSNGGNRGEQR